MNLFKKKKDGSKSRSKKASQKARFSDTPALAAMVERDGLETDMTQLEVDRRKAEFLELLAKEERAHRVKLAELRNEPVQNRRATDVKPETSTHKIDIVSQAKQRTPLPPVASQFENSEPLSPSDTQSVEGHKNDRSDAPSARTVDLPRQTEQQTRADIGKQIGGESFLVGGTPAFNQPELSVDIPKDAPREDVTPPPAPQLSEQMPPLSQTPSPPQSQSAPKEPYADMDFSRPIKGGRANVSELRLDVSRIYSDIENGDALYRRAQQRVQGLMHFVEKAEVDFSLLERIEPENRRLKARNAMMGKELEEAVRKTSLLEADLDEHRRRLSEINVQYDTINGNLAKAMKALSERDREIRQLTNDISAITLKLDREKTATEVEIRENNILRDRVVNLTSELEDVKSARADTTKVVESLKIDLEDHRSARERVESEAYELRRALDEAQRQNNQMKGEMVALHQDISTFKTQYEFNIISRDDRITLLEAQIEDLARQLQIKEDIVASAARDVTELRKSRTGGELERERLEKIIDTQTMQLEAAQNQILESRAAMEEMDSRYRDVAAALSVTQNRRANQAPASAPDIHPDMTERTQAAQRHDTSSRSVISDDYGSRDKDIIEDHIMEYKLGLRNSLIPNELQSKLDKVSIPEDDTNAEQELKPSRDDNFDALDQDTIEDRIMDYKLGLRKNIF